jgi:hypothetical protein
MLLTQRRSHHPKERGSSVRKSIVGDLLVEIDRVDSSIVACIKLAEVALRCSDDPGPSTQNHPAIPRHLLADAGNIFSQSIKSAKTSPNASSSRKLLSDAPTLKIWMRPRQSSIVTLMNSSMHSMSYRPLGPRPRALSLAPNWRRTWITYYNSRKEKPRTTGGSPL